MKTYTFIYYDSKYDFDEGKKSKHLRVLPSDCYFSLDKMRRLPND